MLCCATKECQHYSLEKYYGLWMDLYTPIGDICVLCNSGYYEREITKSTSLQKTRPAKCYPVQLRSDSIIHLKTIVYFGCT